MRNERTVEKITAQALKPGLSDDKRIHELWKLDGVSTPIASALLTIRNPDEYAIIDRIVWGVCRGWVQGQKTYDSAASYLRLLVFCRDQKKELGAPWTARRIECALYAMGEEIELSR